MTRMRLLDCPLDDLTLQETSSLIIDTVQRGAGGVQMSLNTFKIKQYHSNSAVRIALDSSEICSADGSSVVLAAKLLKLGRIERVPGIDLFETLLTECAKKGFSVYLLGSTDTTLSKLERVLSLKEPALVIAGMHNGFWSESDNEVIKEDIINSGAKICFVALPSPMKELWMHENRTAFKNIFLMGVGGSFEVLCEDQRRAPQLLQKLGLEWAFRVFLEPRRLLKRYLQANAFYFKLLVMEILKVRDKT